MKYKPDIDNTYSVSLQDKPKKHQSIITAYPVSKEIARKFYFEFLQLWGKKVRFETEQGITVEGYLHKVQGEFKK